jgi:hypothetical protein
MHFHAGTIARADVASFVSVISGLANGCANRPSSFGDKAKVLDVIGR